MGELNARYTGNKRDEIRVGITGRYMGILSLAEAWSKSTAKFELFKETPLPGYKLPILPRVGNKGFGGVSTL